ncbi:type II secretion system major pseudopilin GspG [Hyphococcus luteus]|uniref:Type II secretion system core protein G n=1 Tax=Hyphococcus luteus TaxID=2058213 RepID=A0A2S7K2T7_9PROT|nr:type II secretion system major pseudopilin GspG [Marinicaulis flavus]PQA86805.1 type II secretion system protein GspG [Marinicaulis flavus]
MKTVRSLKKTRRKQKGFSLVELLVALAILALISAIVVVNVLPARDKAAVDTAKIEIKNLEATLDQYRLDMMNYPTTQQGLEALVTIPADAPSAGNYRPGGYLRGGVPKDPWGNPYQYRFPGERGGAFDLYSYGADGEPGGEGLNADIGNWVNE